MPNSWLHILESLFNHASIGILVVKPDGKISNANPFLLNLFGYDSEEELIGKEVEVLIPKRFDHKHRKYRENYSHRPENRAMGIGLDLYGVNKSGIEFPIEISLGHYRTPDNGVYVFAFVSDISKRKAIEQDILLQKEILKSVNKKMEELNNDLEKKVETRTKQLRDLMRQIEASRDELSKALNKEKELSDMKSRFVSMASHEFRTPLSTILSSASLLAKYTSAEEQDKRDKHIQRIKNSVNNLSGILDEFLAIGRIENGQISSHPVSFNVKDHMETVLSELDHMISNKIHLKYEHEGREDVYLDPSLLRNILLNLLSNAVKFSHQNGDVIIKTKVIGEKELVLTVQDFGIGISEEDQVHLFERFYRAKNATNIQGTGLGLHIVANYVKIMNGHIEWESALEKGTKFNIYLKMNEQKAS